MITILEMIEEYAKQGGDLVLAVVRETEGSVPRRKGAAMLIGPSGILKGSIGGGALEAAVLRAGGECLSEKRCASLTYGLDGGKLLAQSEGDALPTGMICGGRVSVWLQFIDAAGPDRPELCERAKVLTKDGSSAFLCFDMALEKMSVSSFAPKEGQPGFFTIPFGPPERAVVFGGGHIAAALTPILKSVDFRVIVMDDRPEFALPERFPCAEQVVCGDFRHLDSLFSFRANDYAVVVTSGHQHDFEVEEQLLRRDLAYVGVVGSRKKTAAVNARLRAAGISEAQIEKVRTPIGLNIGAVTPQEIAVSIAAEMIAVRAERRK